MRARPAAICLMGPTASGKTEMALQLADVLPVEIISVDSALVYRHMNIGTAKPDAATLHKYPHSLIDIREPEQSYSAGDFVRDATAQIAKTHAAGRTPLLVGGTMMYFRALTQGIAVLPSANERVREELDAEARASGWPALHGKLAAVDRRAAARISANDSQRIQRALEVYITSGRTLSEWHARQDGEGRQVATRFIKVALVPDPRSALHRRIEVRFRQMLELGFLDEVRRLRERPGLTHHSPSMRAVGYRQLWSSLDAECDLDTAIQRALAATRQLAKRQLTWLRTEPDVVAINSLEPQVFGTILALVRSKTGQLGGVGDT